MSISVSAKIPLNPFIYLHNYYLIINQLVAFFGPFMTHNPKYLLLD